MSDLDKFNYECEDQIDIFDLIRKPISITKPIRLIELFAGYGSQAMALRDIGAKFEHYRVVEFDKYAITSYNAVHGTDFQTMDITKVHASDLNICDTEKYCYFMTYSFPCTDLSVAGKQAGMKKGSGTRSGLLWEVERILCEIQENGGELPQQWSNRMEILGSIYTEVSEKFQNGILKGGIPRCIKAEKHDLGVVMAEVKQIGNIAEEKNFSNPQIGRIYDVGGCSPTLSTMQGGGREPKIIVAMRGRNPDNPSDRAAGSPTEQRLEPNMQGISNCLTSVQKDNLVLIKQATKEGSIECEIGGCFDASYPESTTRRGRVQDKGNICPTLTAQNQEIVRIESKYRIRKFTPRECGRLMGVSDEDISKMAAVNSNTQLYKQFGNSIVVDVMCAMFRNLNINQ